MRFRWPIPVRYSYKLATLRSGRIKEGALDAYSGTQAIEELNLTGLRIIEVRFDPAATFSRFFRRPGLREESMHEFFADAHRLLRAGFTVSEACDTVTSTAVDRRLRLVGQVVRDELLKGASFSDALQRSHCFRDLAVSIIKAGEQAGSLPEATKFLEEFYRRKSAFNRQVAVATFYPKLVLVVITLAVLFISFYVLPKFRTAFSTIGIGELPAITKTVFAVSSFINHWWWAMALAGLFGFLALQDFLSRDKGDLAGRFLYRLPFVGQFVKESALAVVFMNFAVLEKSGINVGQGLKMLSNASPYAYIAQRLVFLRQRVERGEPLSEGFKADRFFPELIWRMIRKGETSGELSRYFEELARIYEEKTEDRIERFNSLVAPLLLMLAALVVVTAYLSFFMATNSVLSTMEGKAI